MEEAAPHYEWDNKKATRENDYLCLRFLTYYLLEQVRCKKYLFLIQYPQDNCSTAESL